MSFRDWYVRCIGFAHTVLGAEVEHQECEEMIARLEERRRSDYEEIQYWRRRLASLTTGRKQHG